MSDNCIRIYKKIINKKITKFRFDLYNTFDRGHLYLKEDINQNVISFLYATSSASQVKIEDPYFTVIHWYSK